MPYFPPSTGQTNSVTTVKEVVSPKKVNAQKVNDYSLAAADADSLITLDNTLPIVVTIPTDTTLELPIGTVIELMQLGEGKVSVSGIGVTTNSKDGQKSLKAQYSQATLLKTAVNTWVLTGDLSA